MAKKKLPDEIKKMRGTDQICRMSDEKNIPISKITSLDRAPAWMNSYGKKIYKQLGDTLLTANVLLNEANMYMFTMLCQEMGKYVELQRDIKKEGYVINIFQTVEDEETGEKTETLVSSKTNPKVRISTNAFNNVRLMANEFGLTPSSLASIASNIGSSSVDEYEKYLNS